MNWKSAVIPFALGVTVGVVVTKNWDRIRDTARPLLRGGLKTGSNLLTKGRELYHEKSEKFADLVAEIREEEDARAKAMAAPPAAPKEGA